MQKSLELTNLMSLIDDEACVLRWMSYGLFGSGISALCTLIWWIPAPYGRYTSANWGPLINGRTAWLVQEAPSLLVPVTLWYFDASEDDVSKTVNRVLLSGFVIHYIQRSIIYPLLMRPGKGTPFSLFLMAFTFCCYNGYLQSRYLLQYAIYPPGWLTSPAFIAGSLLFVCGLAINVHSDHILRSLRSKPGETGYKIPYGGMFEFVSGANFFGEIVEWIGFAVACWSLPAAAFAFFTSCNIGPRAISHHRWYRTKFDNYPTSRKALIPFVL